MSEFARIYLDTNIFIFAFEEKDERSQLLSDLISLSSEREKPVLVTSELTLSEVLVRPYQDADDTLIDLYDGFITDSEWLDVLPVIRPTLWYAAVLRSQYKKLKLPDAIHLSTAIGADCTHFMTADEGLRSSYDLSHVRYGVTKNARPLAIIRPDEPTLTSLLQSLAA